MSRLGKKPIPLPKGVEVNVSKGRVEFKGPKGTLSNTFPEGIEVVVGEKEVLVNQKEESDHPPSMHGLYRSLVSNSIDGVSKGFEKRLSLVGVGYRANVKGTLLDIQLGYSHPSQIEIPSDLKVVVEKSVLIIISGIDKQKVGQFAANVRALRPPEPYKGKGIRYEDEFVRKKAGKAAKGK